VKLQDAYGAEKGTVGNWVNIGYIAPGAASATAVTGSGNAFSYAGGDATVTVSCPDGSSKNNDNKCIKPAAEEGGNPTEVSATGGSTTGWIAKSTAKLNDCVLGSTWTIASSTTTGVVAYTKTVNGKEPTADDVAVCASLTPNFASIGK